jgi:DNA-directed RNA polymerase specialized sigma24 family protein
MQHNEAPAAGSPAQIDLAIGCGQTAAPASGQQTCDGDGGSAKENSSLDERSASYARFVVASRERLLRVLVAHHGPDIGAESLADAYAYAWEHWDRVAKSTNTVGYVFRVGDRVGIRRAVKARRESPSNAGVGTHDKRSASGVDDSAFGADLGLQSLLQPLSTRQRAAVLLVHGYGWSYRDAAETMDLPLTTLTNEVTRGLQKLREQMKNTKSMDFRS